MAELVTADPIPAVETADLIPIRKGGASGLLKATIDQLLNFFNSNIRAPAQVITKAASDTLVASDIFSVQLLDSATPITLTVPDNATVPFPIGTQITVVQAGAGAASIVAGAGVTINNPDGLVFRKQHSAATLTKIATDTWHLIGDLVA